MDPDDGVVVRLFFEGEPYRHQELDAAALREIVRFQELVTEAAAALWRSEHPQVARLPNGFNQHARLVFNATESGSAIAPLRRPVAVQGQLLEEGTGYADRAVELLHRAFKAAGRQEPIPADLTPELATKCSRLGSSLEAEATLFFGASSEARISASQSAREHFGASDESTTDFDTLDALIEDAFGSVSEKEWQRLPADGARRLNFYLYGRDDSHTREA